MKDVSCKENQLRHRGEGRGEKKDGNRQSPRPLQSLKFHFNAANRGQSLGKFLHSASPAFAKFTNWSWSSDEAALKIWTLRMP